MYTIIEEHDNNIFLYTPNMKCERIFEARLIDGFFNERSGRMEYRIYSRNLKEVVTSLEACQIITLLRDKMLFADICRNPCYDLSDETRSRIKSEAGLENSDW